MQIFKFHDICPACTLSESAGYSTGNSRMASSRRTRVDSSPIATTRTPVWTITGRCHLLSASSLRALLAIAAISASSLTLGQPTFFTVPPRRRSIYRTSRWLRRSQQEKLGKEISRRNFAGWCRWNKELKSHVESEYSPRRSRTPWSMSRAPGTQMTSLLVGFPLLGYVLGRSSTWFRKVSTRRMVPTLERNGVFRKN